MKRILKICMIMFVVMLSGALRNKSTAQSSMGVSFQVFYDELSPYGEWIYYPEYGYVWSPDDIYNDFHPYRSGGHWVWSDNYEWFWVSDYDWGWAPFHYGRWLYDSYYGWLWVPDYDWAPAWVVWRGGGDYYGWAPMRPGININLYFGRYSLPNDYWCFAPKQYISSPHIYNYCVNVQQNPTIINNTTIINNYSGANNVFVTGPSRSEAESYTHTRIYPVSIREAGNPGRIRERNNEVDVYKPSINRQRSADVAPKTFERYNQNNSNNKLERRNTDNKEISKERNMPSTNEQGNQTTDQERRNNRMPETKRTDNNIPERRRPEQRSIPENERPNNRPDGNNEIQSPQPQYQPQVQNQKNETTNNRPDRNNEIQRPQPQYQPQVQNQKNETPNIRHDRNNEIQRPQPQYQPQVQNQKNETPNIRPGRNNDILKPQPQYEPQMQNQRNERPNNRPDIRNNEVQRPQPQYQPQVQNRGIQQREKPQMENKSEQGSRGNGQQINHGGGRWHN